MTRVQQLEGKIAEEKNKLEALKKKVSDENRVRTDDEKTEWKTLQSNIDDFKEQLADERADIAQKAEEAKAKGTPLLGTAEAGRSVSDKERKEVAKYSVTKAIRQTIEGKMDGVEAEMHQEAQKEARDNGHTLQGLGIPQSLIRARSYEEIQTRTHLTVGTAATAGNLVDTQLQELIPILRPELQVVRAGATVLRDLRSDLKFPRQNAKSTATWEGEIDANAETNPTTETFTMSPKRLGAFSVYTKQLLAQSSTDVDAFVRRDLDLAVAEGLDSAAINGSGVAPIPTGILNVTGIGDVAGGTNGAVPTWGNVVDLQTELTNDNAFAGRLAYLTTPGIKGVFMQTEKATNTAQFILGESGQNLAGYPFLTSTQVPNNLTKGTSNDCHAIIFGNFQDLLIGQWGGLDLVIDPYTLAKNAEIQIVINSWWDVNVRHAESFAAMQDALLS